MSYLNYSPDLSILDHDPRCNRWQEEEDVVEGSEFDPLLNYTFMIKIDYFEGLKIKSSSYVERLWI